MKRFLLASSLVFLAALPADAQRMTTYFYQPNPISPGFGHGRWYSTPITANSSATPTAGKLYAAPIYVPTISTVKTLGFNVSATSAGNWQARMGIYYALGGTGQEAQPGDLVPLTDTGNLSYTSATTGGQSATINGSTGVVLQPGWYFLAWTYDTGTVKVTSATAQNSWLNGEVLGTSGSGTAITGLSPTVSVAFVYTGAETLPTTFGTPSYNATGPVLAMTAQ